VANLVVEMSTRRDPWAQIMLIVDDALAGYRPGDDLAGRLWIEAWRFAIRDVEMRSDVHRDYATWHQLIVDATDEGVRSGRFMTSLSSDQVAVVTLALLDGVGLRLVAGDPQVDFDQASEVVSEALRQLLRVKSL
jgi:hypothetical protein